jgi:hypothetical protein
MSLSILEVAKEFSRRQGLPVPNVGFSSQDDGILQILGLANKVVEDLLTRRTWTDFQKETTWTLTGLEDQGSLDTLAPYGYKWMIKDTFWDRTRRLPITGPVNASEWQMIKGVPMTSPWLRYRIRGRDLLLTGSITAGHTVAFEYASDWGVKDSGGAYKKFFTADSDVFQLNESLLLAGLEWMWLNKKGFAYSEQFRSYEILVAEYGGHDGTKPTLHMDGAPSSVQPAVVIPVGDWQLP